jgi:hypothetical protein
MLKMERMSLDVSWWVGVGDVSNGVRDAVTPVLRVPFVDWCPAFRVSWDLG